MGRTVRQFQKGQGLVEYALLLVLMAVIAILALNISGISTSDLFNQIKTGIEGEDDSCKPLAEAGDEWESSKDKFWYGGIEQQQDGYKVCPLCGGLLPGFSDSDYQLDLSGVTVKNTNATWNGYGITFRAENGANGLNGYMFEVEKVNKNNPTRIYFSKWVNGVQIKPYIKMYYLPSDIDWNNPPDMSVKVEGNTFTAYMNGQQVLQGSDKTYTEGGAGVFSNAGTELSFSDFLINPLNCPEVK
jgi:Flp pilus assembly pilin Flp